MINKIKFFIAWFVAFVNRKKIAKADAEKKAKAKQELDKRFLTETKDLAQEFTNMHKAFTKQYPTNYLKKMQPYFNVLQKKMKEHNIDPVAAALMVVTKKTRNRDMIAYYATAAEMTDNIKKTTTPFSVQTFEMGIIKCPQCGFDWNLETKKVCDCGASIVDKKPNLKTNVKFITDNGTKGS